MRDYERIEGLIRAARVQRSARLGTLLGNLIGEAWLRTADFTASMSEYLSGRPEIPPQSVRTEH